MAGMQKFAKVAAAGFAAASAAGAGAFAAISNRAQEADKQFKASQTLGVPIQQLGRLAHAAEMSGSSFDEVGKAAQRASRAVNDSMNGVSNAGTKAFEQLGIGLKTIDGEARGVEDILGDVAERFAKMPDGATKTALAIEMFGRSGANLIPMLNQGREGLKEMGDEAERLGLVFSGKTGRASEIFNDNISRMSKTFTGLWNMVLAKVIPSFVSLTNRMVAASQQGGILDKAVDGISAAMNIMAKGIALVFDNLHHLYELFKVFVAAKIVGFMVSAARSFILFAKAVRTAGIASALFSKVISGKITLLVGVAYVTMKLTNTLDQFTATMKELGEQVAKALPENIRNAMSDLAGPLQAFEGDIVDADLAVTTFGNSAIDSADGAANSFGTIGEKMKTAIGGIKGIASDATSAMSKMGDMANSAFRSIGSSLRGLIDGSKNWLDVLSDIMMNLAQMAFSNINFGGGFGGIIGSLLGGLFSFDGGGYTGDGPRTGGLDGIGGRLALVHPQETIIDHTKGQRLAGGGNVQIDQTFVLDGAIDGQRIQQMIQQGTAQSVETVKRALPGWQVEQQKHGAIA
ncbi:hypothetical protein [Maritalea sp. S77]|uniref:hypothetical protein n=1 Tax=Maritalea sp. S77 TaxID=3415125 RepID=UPI003C7D3B71